MKIIISFLSIFTCTFCFGQSDWSYIGSSVNKMDYYIKDIRKTYKDDVYSIWLKIEYPEKKVKNKKGQWTTVAGNHTISSSDINCTEKETKLDRVIKYSNKGIVLKDQTMYSEWERIIPESMAEAVFNFVCGEPE